MEEGDTKALRFKRGTLKAKLTRFQTFLSSIEEEESLTQLKVRLGNIEPLINEFEHIQDQLEKENGFESELQERDEFESNYCSLVAKAKEKIDSKSTLLHEHVRTAQDLSQVRLPVINIHPFSGQYQDWLSFQDTFTSLILDKKQLGHVQKSLYRRSKERL